MSRALRAFRPRRELSDWRVSPIAPDVPAGVESSAVAFLRARERHSVALGRHIEARDSGHADGLDDRSGLDLEIALDRVADARVALRGALDGRRGYHPAGGMLVGLVSGPCGLDLKVMPAAMSPYHPARHHLAEARP